jgi:leucyl-tRNA synthetase
VVNGFVLMDGQKMSKSLGNILPLRKAIKEYGPDPIRISVTGISEIGEDTDFNQKMVEGIISKLYFMNEMSNNLSKEENVWLELKCNMYMNECIEAYEKLDLRTIVNNLIYKFTNDIKWSIRRGKPLNEKIFSNWLKLMTPLAPHFCEEMWHKIGNTTFIVNEQIKKVDLVQRDYEIENEKERIIEEVVNDINEIKKLLNKNPETTNLFIASEFKRKIFRKVESGNINEVIKNVMQDEEIKKRGKEAMSVIKSGTKWKKSNIIFTQQDEFELIKNELKFIESETGTKIILTNEEEAGESMKERASKSLPAKPSIFFI